MHKKNQECHCKYRKCQISSVRNVRTFLDWHFTVLQTFVLFYDFCEIPALLIRFCGGNCRLNCCSNDVTIQCYRKVQNFVKARFCLSRCRPRRKSCQSKKRGSHMYHRLAKSRNESTEQTMFIFVFIRSISLILFTNLCPKWYSFGGTSLISQVGYPEAWDCETSRHDFVIFIEFQQN